MTNESGHKVIEIPGPLEVNELVVGRGFHPVYDPSLLFDVRAMSGV